jgi:hypothetical protein
VSCGSSTFLSRSTDEGLTFPILKTGTLPAFDELRIDSKGTLYAVRRVGTQLLLQTSGNGGRSWSKATNLVAPKLRGAAIGQWALAIRGPGQLAVAYLTAHAGGGWNGSVTLTRNALATRPVFTSSTVHDGKRVLVTSPQSAKDDYIDLDVAPDGSAWASFFGDCGTDPACATSAQNPMAKISILTHLS